MSWCLLFLMLGLLVGCAHTEPLPPVPPPPEDLSTWTVPEVVQPPLSASEVPAPAPDKPTAAERVFAFTPGTTFTVMVPVNAPLDVLLERGEQVRNIVGGGGVPSEAPPAALVPGGDPSERQRTLGTTPASVPEASVTARWEAKEGAEGQGDTLRPHVFLAATAPGLTTGVILTTTRRTYYLTCTSVKTSPVRVVRWTYATEGTTKPLKAKEPGLLPDPQEPRHYHVGYELVGSQPPPSW